jgi:uncharacterized membrane protein
MAARMKRLVIFLIVVPLMIGIFLLTRGITAEHTSLAWALDRIFFVTSTSKAKMIQPPLHRIAPESFLIAGWQMIRP